MNYHIKYIFLVLINITLLVTFFFISRMYGWDTEKYIIDLDLSKDSDFYMLGLIIIIFVISFITSFFIFSSNNVSFKTSDMENMIKLARQIR